MDAKESSRYDDLPPGSQIVIPCLGNGAAQHQVDCRVKYPDGEPYFIDVSALKVGDIVHVSVPVAVGTMVTDLEYTAQEWQPGSPTHLRAKIDQVAEHEPVRALVPLLANPAPICAAAGLAGIFPPFCDVIWLQKAYRHFDEPQYHLVRWYQDAKGEQRNSRVPAEQLADGALVYVCSSYMPAGAKVLGAIGEWFLPVHWDRQLWKRLVEDVRERTPMTKSEEARVRSQRRNEVVRQAWKNYQKMAAAANSGRPQGFDIVASPYTMNRTVDGVPIFHVVPRDF